MKSKTKLQGFSLIEVVIALAIVAVAMPIILGVFSTLSSSSEKVRDLNDVESIVTAVQIYLENETATTNRFDEVYDWVQQARANPDDAVALYVYRSEIGDADGNSDDEDVTLTVSEELPGVSDVSAFDARVVAVEFHAPEETLLPADDFPVSIDDYQRAYLPMRIDMKAAVAGVSSSSEDLGRAFESLPFVLKR